VQPNPLDFGNTETKTTKKLSVTLTNTCATPATGIVPTVTGADANLFTLDSWPASLSSGDQATVNITYAPAALGMRSLANAVFGDSDSQTAILNLFGEPVGVALSLAPNPCSFGVIPLGDVGRCCTTITADANVAVNITGLTGLSGSNYDDAGFMWDTFEAPNTPNPEYVPITLDPGGSVEACFDFYPFSTQVVTSQATLQTNDPSGVDPIIRLAGMGSN
jgi:hypothetical protein